MMISESMRHFLANLPYVFVVTADEFGQPHMAIGEQLTISGDSQLVFENWFCPATLRNIGRNTRVSVVAVKPDTGQGFQMIGWVVRSNVMSMLDNYSPGEALRGTPQALTKFAVKIDKVLEFTGGIHTDLPIMEETGTA